MQGSKSVSKKKVLPLLPLRGLTVFPHMILTFDVGREKSINALDEAMMNNQLIFLTTQKDAKVDSPDVDDIYKAGTISRVKQLLRLPGNTIRVLVEGLNRAEVRKYVQTEPFFIAEVVERNIPADRKKSIMDEALRRKVISTFEDYARTGKYLPKRYRLFQPSRISASFRTSSPRTCISGSNRSSPYLMSSIPKKGRKSSWNCC